MIYGKELEEYIRNMEKLAKGAKEKTQDPKTRAPMKYAMLAKDYELRADIARLALAGERERGEADLLRSILKNIGGDADRALHRLDTDTERPSAVRAALYEAINAATLAAGYISPWRDREEE